MASMFWHPDKSKAAKYLSSKSNQLLVNDGSGDFKIFAMDQRFTALELEIMRKYFEVKIAVNKLQKTQNNKGLLIPDGDCIYTKKYLNQFACLDCPNWFTASIHDGDVYAHFGSKNLPECRHTKKVKKAKTKLFPRQLRT